ncbi:MAG: hypothetical protein IT165_31225 [Bryobacterales bacterium]|nr:hypothetical protein [Bryobacterales bacterium]
MGYPEDLLEQPTREVQVWQSRKVAPRQKDRGLNALKLLFPEQRLRQTATEVETNATGQCCGGVGFEKNRGVALSGFKSPNDPIVEPVLEQQIAEGTR